MMIPLEKLSQQMDHHFLGSRPEQNYETAGTTSVGSTNNHSSPTGIEIMSQLTTLTLTCRDDMFSVVTCTCKQQWSPDTID
eukprot:scaffold637_cov217-Amphora_coffeaeformis.AAC.2